MNYIKALFGLVVFWLLLGVLAIMVSIWGLNYISCIAFSGFAYVCLLFGRVLMSGDWVDWLE